MYYRDLFIGHKAFWKIERRAKHYDIYMKELKNWEKWPDSVSIDEIEKLMQFVPKWNLPFRRKNPIRFAEIFKQILPTIKELYDEKLENAKFHSEYLQKIRVIFDKVAKCQNRYESTECSKILHTILPHLIVMWDKKIRLGILGNENKKKGSMYALDFLPKMQKELLEAIETCIEQEKLERDEAIKYIRQECGNETLPKLINELNYVTYTRTIDFKYYLEKNKEDGELLTNDFRRLVQKLPSL
jgi:hypothetical protein